MPIGGLFNIEWLNANSQRNYPLAADASGLDTSGSFRLPEDFIVDLQLKIPVSVDAEPDRFFIRSIGAYGSGFSVVVGYSPTVGDPVTIATASFARSVHEINNSYTLSGVGDYTDAHGQIVIGRLENIDLQPSGTFDFNLAGGRLEVAVIRPQIRGIGGLFVVNGTDRSSRISYDVEFAAGTNVRIRYVPPSMGSLPQLIFDAIEGEGLNETCICEGTELGPPILSVNGVGPGPTGNIDIIGSPCLEIVPITNGLKFTDICSGPCCDCVDLKAITGDMEVVQRAVDTLNSFYTGLAASVTQTDQVILGSRLQDRGC